MIDIEATKLLIEKSWVNIFAETDYIITQRFIGFCKKESGERITTLVGKEGSGYISTALGTIFKIYITRLVLA